MAAQEYQPLSHALNPPPARTNSQNQQADLPRLQLAPPQHQKHSQAQAQVRQQVNQQPQRQQSASESPTAQRPSDERPTSLPSSREVSPAVGVETSPSSGQKRKPDTPKSANSKKRKTDQTQEDTREAPLPYGLGTHYPYTYAYPGAPPPPPLPVFHPPPVPNGATPGETSFNEFQWRLLNLCGEFYEAATELIRSTPHHVLSQAFQLLGRGSGLDPIGILNEARRTCDMLLANPQSLSTAPPPPASLPLPVLTSLGHLNSRAGPPSTSSVAPPAYYPPQPSNTISEQTPMFKGKEKEKAPVNVQGTWKDHEVDKLKVLAEKYRVRDKTIVTEEEEEEEEEEGGEGQDGIKPPKIPKTTKEMGDIDWDKVVAEFGDERSRHQVLIKATYLGLKPSSSVPGKKPKKKRTSMTSVEPPPPTFSSASAKSIPVGYSASHLQSPSVTPTTPSAPAQSKPAATSVTPATPNSSHTSATAPPLPPPPHPQGHHPQYGQTGWYPHPQNPYYAYHQPMYYSPHPQSYGMQQQAYYGQPYVPPPPPPSIPEPEKQTRAKGKRKDAKKDGVQPAGGSAKASPPVPPPSLPPKAAAVAIPGETPPTKPAAVAAPAPASDAPTSTPSTPQGTPSLAPASAPTSTGSSGVLRRGPTNNLFTYTPLPHGPGTPVTEQTKDA